MREKLLFQEHVHGVMQLYSFIIFFVSCWKSRGDVLLDYTNYGGNRDNSAKAAIIVSHGLFGSKKNWRTICKHLSKLSGRQVGDHRMHTVLAIGMGNWGEGVEKNVALRARFQKLRGNLTIRVG